MSDPRWRVGQKLGRTLYRDDVCVGMVDDVATAKAIVAAMNTAVESMHPTDTSYPLCSCDECVRHKRRCVHIRVSPQRNVGQ